MLFPLVDLLTQLANYQKAAAKEEEGLEATMIQNVVDLQMEMTM